MSGQATGWVLRYGPRPDDRSKAGEPYGLPKARAMRAVLGVVADAANRDGDHAHPGVAALVEGSLYTRSHVLATLRLLVDEDWLAVEQEGRGRGNATVYRVCMERVRTEDLSSNGKGPLVDEKRSSAGREKVQSEAPAPLLSNGTTQRESPTGAEAPPPTSSDRARAIADFVWENRTPKPATPYIGVVKVLERILDAGWDDGLVREAAMVVPTISTGALEFDLSRRRPQRRVARSNGSSIDRGGEAERLHL